MGGETTVSISRESQGIHIANTLCTEEIIFTIITSDLRYVSLPFPVLTTHYPQLTEVKLEVLSDNLAELRPSQRCLGSRATQRGHDQNMWDSSSHMKF